MKFYLAHYRIYDGEHEYAEHGIFASRSYETAVKRAEKRKRFLTGMGGQNIAGLIGSRKYQNRITSF